MDDFFVNLKGEAGKIECFRLFSCLPHKQYGVLWLLELKWFIYLTRECPVENGQCPVLIFNMERN